MPARFPFTDAFGTLIDPDALWHSLDLPQARLVLRDDGVLVEYAGVAEDSEAVARASTGIRSMLSPLVPCRFERIEPLPTGARMVDERTQAPSAVALAEVFSPADGFPAGIDNLLSWLPLTFERVPPSGALEQPSLGASELASVMPQFMAALTERAPVAGLALGDLTVSVLMETKQGTALLGAANDPSRNGRLGPHFLVWLRRGGAVGVRPAILMAASRDLHALRWLAAAMEDSPGDLSRPNEVLLHGLTWGVGRRPTIAVPRPTPDSKLEIFVDPDRCTECGLCAEVCPTNYLDTKGRPAAEPDSHCIRCYDCVEACPVDALRPTESAGTHTLGRVIDDKPGWLARLRGAPGPSFPAPFPPSYLLPKPKSEQPAKPRYVLGLAIITMQEHAAALLKDGVLVGAIEEERLSRVRHHGWKPQDRPGVTLGVDPTLALEEPFARRSIRALLQQEGITLDDVDVIALNGIPSRYRATYSLLDETRPLRTVRAGRMMYIPHHLTHAASTYRASGFENAWIFTADGRGDRETAALFRAEKGQIKPVFSLLSLNDRSIGGVYETVTRILGLGGHGQGSTMALAAYGQPTMDMRPFLSAKSLRDIHIHEQGPMERYGELRREYDGPLTQEHKDLAASAQKALEDVVETLLREGGVHDGADAICFAGGVALNCRMNGTLRNRFQPQRVFAQPGANDGGTAVGAALQGWTEATGQPPQPMADAYLGPAFTDAEIEPFLRRSGLPYRKVDAIAEETAQRIATGQVVCWFQGRMEFGPRALGARSILADPRGSDVKDRVNRIKDRQDWRPFAPSILAGHEGEWLENAFDSRFMLFALNVREEKRALVPAVVHADGSTRPQVVHAETSPAYHAMISAFHRLTGVPLVVNTSFNRRGEPIVCTPRDALESFRGLGADALAIGNFIVERGAVPLPALPADAELQSAPRGRRLMLRLTTHCDCDTDFCTLQDLRGLPDRSTAEALQCLAEGRQSGCDEVVFLRGEVTHRRDLPELVTRAKRMGYRFVQIQTSGRPLAVGPMRDALLRAGVDSFEITLVSGEETVNDELLFSPGAFRETATAIRAIAQSGRQLLVTVPVLRRTMAGLGRTVAVAQKLGVKRIQFNFPRPVELQDRIATGALPSLTGASHYVRLASRLAAQMGLAVSTEGIPFCHLEEPFRAVPDATESWQRYRVDDLHLLHESLTEVRQQARPEPPPCRACSAREHCPKTWALYQELFGSGELKTLA
jgi:predicted NodU family carbamoyl transferase/ferredoxin